MAEGAGTAESPWLLSTPPGSSQYTAYRTGTGEEELLVVTVGTTVLTYAGRCVPDLHAMLLERGDWVELGSADEGKEPKPDTVEAWGRSPDNPVGGWYGLKKGLRGRFGMYIPPLMEKLGLAEVTHDAKGNKMSAI